MIASILAMTGFAAVVLAPAKPAFAGDQLTVTSWGGALQKSMRGAYFEPFSKVTGIKVTEDEWNGEIAKIRAMVESKTVSWDVVDGDRRSAIQLCNEGILEKIDWTRLGLDRSKFIGGDKYDCGVPSFISATVVAYDKDKLPNGPKTMADLFDLKKFPGKRGLWKNPYQNLEWALVADGVATKDVYAVLSTPEGVDRAFKKLDTIKKDVVWWEAGAQPPQLLADGQVVMTSAWNGRVYDAIKNSGKHFGIMWDAEMWGADLWVIPRGGPRLDDAYKFIAFASSAQAQADLTHYISYGPTNKDALALVDAPILPDLPTAPEHMANSIETNHAFWAERGDELRQRFTAWLAK
ncbi:ABC transporter substrate-binding protein [Bradyrhizobium sp. Ghvi]|uniref:ABC transporter substrate-binding protein n=1 Tax=Bradyrhizobium sp. Ghvi TaxID=1855319 RepID=UPI001FCD3CD9|nr:ABC transporter substrate-binding protein [Bradyrhizobium sp. Ghvi]